MPTPLKSVQSEEITRLTTKPIQYLEVAAEDEENGGRGSALVLTKEDILSIKRYERYSLNLPTTLRRVEEQLGFSASGIPGLEPPDMLATYTAINQHALSWTPIEAHVKNTGFELDLFAQKFVNQGNLILAAVEKMELFDQLNLTVAGLTPEIIDALAPAPLAGQDKLLTTNLASFLAKLGQDIQAYERSCAALKDQIATFSETLRNSLIPSVNDKLQLAKKSNLEQQVGDLSKDIDRLTLDIQQKNKEYSTTKNNIAWGVFGGPLGVAITGGIFGSKAEKIRKEKNRLIAEKDAKVRELKSKQPLAAAVRSLEVQFEDMYIRLEDAHQSASNLQDLWALMAAYVTHSAKELAEIEDNQTLLIFTLQFQAVITPWKKIRGITTRLLKIFDSALEQFALEQNG